MKFSRQDYWSGLSFPSSGDLPDPRIKPGSPALQAASVPREKPHSVPHSIRNVLSSQVLHPLSEPGFSRGFHTLGKSEDAASPFQAQLALSVRETGWEGCSVHVLLQGEGAPWPPSVRFSIHQPAPGLASFPQEPGAHGAPPSASPHLVSPALRPPGPGRHPLVTPPQPHRALLEKVPASRGLTPPRGHQAPKPAWGVPHLSSSATHLHAPAHTAVLLPEKTKTHL